MAPASSRARALRRPTGPPPTTTPNRSVKSSSSANTLAPSRTAKDQRHRGRPSAIVFPLFFGAAFIRGVFHILQRLFHQTGDSSLLEQRHENNGPANDRANE